MNMVMRKKYFMKPMDTMLTLHFSRFSLRLYIWKCLTSLNEPNSIVISEQISRKIFGNENPVNKSITVGLPYGDFSYTVKGVFDDSKIKSHIPLIFFFP